MNKLLFGDFEVGKENFYESKESIKLKDVDADNIVVSNKIKVNDKIGKLFIGYVDDNNVIPLSIVLNQMSGKIKYEFQN